MYLNLFFLFLDGFSINKYEIVENSTIKNIKKIFIDISLCEFYDS